MKRTTIILFFALLLSISVGICFASVPLRWTVETSRLQPVAFDALHGETLELAASFQSYGKPLAVTGPAALYYQTNGMGAAWWQIPATVASNRIEAVFPPSADPGAARLNCFLGGTASTYRAAFSLRFATSPGATPNTLPLPVTKLDLAAVEVLNAPWLMAETDPTVPDWAKQPNAPATMTTNAVKDIVTAADDVYEWRWHGDVPAGTLSIVANEAGEPARIYIDGKYAGFTDAPYSPGTLQFGPFVMLPDYEIRFFYGEKMIVGRRNRLGLAMADDIPDVTPLNREIARKADASTVNALSNTVTQWTTYWYGRTNTIESLPGAIAAATNALPDWTKSSSKPSYSPWEIGALGIYDMAESAWYASEAGTAYHANGVDWSNVSGRPQNIVTFDKNADDPLDTAEKILERASAGSGGNNDYFIEDHGTGFSYRIVATNGVLFAEKVENAQ